MDKILSINTIKNVFAALGAKTSDSNYGVALLDKTTAEPKGLMGMSDLASVLGVIAPINAVQHIVYYSRSAYSENVPKATRGMVIVFGSHKTGAVIVHGESAENIINCNVSDGGEYWNVSITNSVIVGALYLVP